MRVYLSGPITGMPDANKPAFAYAEQALRAKGYEVVNPHNLPHVAGSTWSMYMRLDLVHLLACDCIVMLPGWERSRGARLEMQVAAEVGMQVHIGLHAAMRAAEEEMA